MKKGWILIAVLVIVIVIGCIVFFTLPSVSSAPTTHGPNTTPIGTGATPQPAVITDTIEVDAPLSSTTVISPLTISGRARGTWYFEATAPVELKDASGTVVGHGTIRAQSDWMTTDYVPFIGTLTFTAPATHTGTLVLKNDNPSGDPAKQKELDIPVQF